MRNRCGICDYTWHPRGALFFNQDWGGMRTDADVPDDLGDVDTCHGEGCLIFKCSECGKIVDNCAFYGG